MTPPENTSPTSEHPGLGPGTDVTAADLDVQAPAPVPASEDPEQRQGDELGTGDGVAVQPGGSDTQPGGDD